jgi:hypothetical protein
MRIKTSANQELSSLIRIKHVFAIFEFEWKRLLDILYNRTITKL